MKRIMRKLSSEGDTPLAEYEVGVTSPERLAEIEKEFDQMVKDGWNPADITDHRDVIINKFDPDADILMIPRIQGGE